MADKLTCRYCQDSAEHVLMCFEAQDALAVCIKHDFLGRAALAEEGVPRTIPVLREGGYGLRVSPLREAEVGKAAPKKEDPFKTVTPRDAETLWQALASDWKRLRAVKLHKNRLSVDLDGQIFTVYTRKG